MSGVDIGTVLFDLKPVPEPIEPDRDWVPRPSPSSAELAAHGVAEAAETPFKLARRAVRAATHPLRSARRVAEAGEALAEVAWNFTNPAPDVPLNTEIGSHRRFAWTRAELEDFKRIKDALGGTVNDVVLTVVSGALRSWLRSRGIKTEGLELRALVPVSIRAEDERGQLGNRIAAMRGPLPVYIEDPVKRLDVVRRAMDGLKESKQALGAEVISRFNDFAPPTLLAQASRINFSTRLFNLIVTNVPGPQIPLYVLGRELEDAFPVAFLPENHALAIAIMSYNGGIDFGLLGDYDAMEDIEMIATGLSESLADLRRRSRGHRGPRPGGDRRRRGLCRASESFLRRAFASGVRGGLLVPGLVDRDRVEPVAPAGLARKADLLLGGLPVRPPARGRTPPPSPRPRGFSTGGFNLGVGVEPLHRSTSSFLFRPPPSPDPPSPLLPTGFH